MSNIIAQIEAEQMNKTLPEFSVGDTVIVQVKVKEGSRERLQAFEGVVIAKRNRGLNSAFTVRKISHGEGVERVFQTYSPLVDAVEVKRRGSVRRAKLYYLRDLRGRAARIKEKISVSSKVQPVIKEKAVVSNVKADDLTKIEGVGPKIAETLQAAGLNTFADVASSNAEKIREILDAAEGNFASHDPETWPMQSELARDEKWDELKELQDKLDGGRQ